MNDPNGMFCNDGVWHLYYQYNPYGSKWQNMTWGHSASKDLVNWTHEPEAIRPDGLGTVFSGSCVVDTAGTAGYGKGHTLRFDRRKSGIVDFSESFPAVTAAPTFERDGKLSLRIFIDRSSIECFGNNGRSVMTNLVFPNEPYSTLSVAVAGGKALIADNTFLNIPMPSIYISDDARSWYESGAVDGVTIVRNRFINCASPVIGIDPENDVYKGPVHRGIVIEDNTFEWDEAYRSAHPDFTPTLISAEAVDGIIIRRNSCNIPCNPHRVEKLNPHRLPLRGLFGRTPPCRIHASLIHASLY